MPRKKPKPQTRRAYGSGTLRDRPGRTGRIRYQAQCRVAGARQTQTFDRLEQAELWLGHAGPLAAIVAPAGLAALIRHGATAESLAQLAAWDRVGPAEVPLGAHLAAWMERQPRRATATQANRAAAVAAWSPLAKLPVGSLTRQAVQSQVTAWQDSRRLSAGTIRNHLSYLRAALRPLVPGVLAENPAAGIEIRRAQRRPPKAWNDEEARSFLAWVAARRQREEIPDGWDNYEVLYPLALATGLRRGELVALRWENLSTDCRTIWVRLNATRDGAIGDLKDREERRVRLDPEPAALLRRHRAAQPPGTAWVFLSPNGGHYHPETISASFSRHQRRVVGLRRLPFHGLRHSYATIQLGKGIPLPVIAEALGHADPSITAKAYAHALPNQQDLAAETIARTLFGSENQHPNDDQKQSLR